MADAVGLPPKITVTGNPSPPLAAPKRAARKPDTRKRHRPSRAKARPAPGLGSAPAGAPQAAAGPSVFVDPSTQAQLHDVLLMVVGGLSFFLAAELRPTREECDLIFLPAERIMMRHASIPGEISPDVTDGIQCLIGVAVYASRITPTLLGARRQQPAGPGPATGSAPEPPPAPESAAHRAPSASQGYRVPPSLAGIYAPVADAAQQNNAGASQ